MNRLLAQHAVVALARTELLHGKPAGGAPRQRLGQPQGEGRAQRVLGCFPRGQLSFPGQQGRRCTLRAARGARGG